MAADFSYFRESWPAVMVVTHERSGTHFLMNSLASCWGYVSDPWIDLDSGGDNLLLHHTREQIASVLVDMTRRPMANLVKSHHTADFFTGELERLTRSYVILSVHRHPADVMLSFWRYLHSLPAKREVGPRMPDPITQAKAAPSGLMERYQTQPCASLLDRWARHVRGWHEAARRHSRIRLLRYEDLDQHFEETMRGLTPWLGREALAIVRPSRSEHVIPGGPLDPLGTGQPPDVVGLRKVCREMVGETMDLLGYQE